MAKRSADLHLDPAVQAAIDAADAAVAVFQQEDGKLVDNGPPTHRRRQRSQLMDVFSSGPEVIDLVTPPSHKGTARGSFDIAGVPKLSFDSDHVLASPDVLQPPAEASAAAVFSPVAGWGFGSVAAGAMLKAQVGARQAYKAVTAKQPRWRGAEDDKLLGLLTQLVKEGKVLDGDRIKAIEAQLPGRSWSAIRGRCNRVHKLGQALAAAEGVPPTAPAPAPLASWKPPMVPTNARLVADLMNACVEVDDNIDAAKKYTSCFQCACGGALRVIKTSAENKQRFHLVDDFFIGCCRYAPNKPDSCNAKYTIKDLQSAVNQAPRDFCR